MVADDGGLVEGGHQRLGVTVTQVALRLLVELRGLLVADWHTRVQFLGVLRPVDSLGCRDLGQRDPAVDPVPDRAGADCRQFGSQVADDAG